MEIMNRTALERWTGDRLLWLQVNAVDPEFSLLVNFPGKIITYKVTGPHAPVTPWHFSNSASRPPSCKYYSGHPPISFSINLSFIFNFYQIYWLLRSLEDGQAFKAKLKAPPA